LNNLGFSKLLRTIVKDYGILYLYRGLLAQVIRAFPTTATGMIVFDFAKT
jgi:hypothetical protein